MFRFIELEVVVSDEDYTGKPLVITRKRTVNVAHIVTMDRVGNWTHVVMSIGKQMSVVETPHKILSLI